MGKSWKCKLQVVYSRVCSAPQSPWLEVFWELCQDLIVWCVCMFLFLHLSLQVTSTPFLHGDLLWVVFWLFLTTLGEDGLGFSRLRYALVPHQPSALVAHFPLHHSLAASLTIRILTWAHHFPLLFFFIFAISHSLCFPLYHWITVSSILYALV